MVHPLFVSCIGRVGGINTVPRSEFPVPSFLAGQTRYVERGTRNVSHQSTDHFSSEFSVFSVVYSIEGSSIKRVELKVVFLVDPFAAKPP